MRSFSILWRRLDVAGHDSARLIEDAAGSIVEGTAVFLEQGQSCRLDYRVTCDAAWRTTSARVTGWLGDRTIGIEMTADTGRRWTIGGVECPSVQGCDDVDLSFSPVTNLLPIRRLGLHIGQRASARAAWLDFPSFRLEPLEQIYERLRASSYRYESGGGAFTTTLQVNAAGIVTSYPPFWEEEVAR